MQNETKPTMKRQLFRTIGWFAYFGALLLLIVMQVKPGSAIFFRKIDLITDDTQIQDGVIISEVEISPTVYDFDSIIVRENGIVLQKVKTENLPSSDGGVFSVEVLDNSAFMIRVVPTSGTSASSLYDSLQILIRPKIVTSQLILPALIFLVVGLVFLCFTLLSDSEKLKTIFGSIRGIINIGQPPQTVKIFLSSRWDVLKTSIVVSVLLGFLFVFFEWVFFVTKPSFMDLLNLRDKLSVFFITGLILAIGAIFLTFLVLLLDFIFTGLISPLNAVIYHLPSSFLLTSLVLILFDNFTYTVFNFGIVNSSNVFRALYAIGFIVGCSYFAYYFSSKAEESNSSRKFTKIRSTFMFLLVLISLIFAGIGYQPIKPLNSEAKEDDIVRTPNIILLSDDGLNAANMSVYGYEHDTTSFMKELAKSSLVMFNNFTNANTSTGSDTSMLTGKLPFETQVLYPPNTLKGMDMYEHLPGILKKQGYRTVSYGVPHFVDVNTINFRNAFDSVNCVESASSYLAETATQLGYNDTVYFFKLVEERISSRLGHIFFIKKMKNPYEIVKGESDQQLSENTIMNCLKNDLLITKETEQPLFAHVHLISTHGPKFEPNVRKFSLDADQDEDWMTAFYDDAILNYDMLVEDFVDFLLENRLYENSILVLYTDHASGWSVKQQIPLIIHFPNDSFLGEVYENTQNLDIPGTLLEYMNLDQPVWMKGNSLLDDLDEKRLIYSAVLKSIHVEGGSVVEEDLRPPFYHFGWVNVIHCNRLYEIDLHAMTISGIDISSTYAPCEETEYSEEYIWKATGTMLVDLGYDLPEEWPYRMATQLNTE